MKGNGLKICGFSSILLVAGLTYSTELVVDSFDSSGVVKWTAPALNVTCRVEWASSPSGPWFGSWSNQQTIVATSLSNEVPVAMFYRVACDVPEPHFSDITTAQSLDLLMRWESNTNFVVLDVRTVGEYTDGHISNAVNIDYYAEDFNAQLDTLNKSKTYLIYCRSGARSGQAHDTMLGLGFNEVYNMLGGFSTFENEPGASTYIER